jgi:hypothetical protein
MEHIYVQEFDDAKANKQHYLTLGNLRKAIMGAFH